LRRRSTKTVRRARSLPNHWESLKLKFLKRTGTCIIRTAWWIFVKLKENVNWYEILHDLIKEDKKNVQVLKVTTGTDPCNEALNTRHD
jgi:hypothetical protein